MGFLSSEADKRAQITHGRGGAGVTAANHPKTSGSVDPLGTHPHPGQPKYPSRQSRMPLAAGPAVNALKAALSQAPPTPTMPFNDGHPQGAIDNAKSGGTVKPAVTMVYPNGPATTGQVTPRAPIPAAAYSPPATQAKPGAQA